MSMAHDYHPRNEPLLPDNEFRFEEEAIVSAMPPHPFFDIPKAPPSIMDSADHRGAQAKEDRSDIEMREQSEFWQAVFQTDRGCQEIWNLLNMGHPFETRFAHGPSGVPDNNAQWYEKGQQDFALRMLQTLERACRDGVWRMRQRHDPRLQKPREPKRIT